MGHRMAFGGVVDLLVMGLTAELFAATYIYAVIVILYTTHIPRTQLAIFCKGAHA